MRPLLLVSLAAMIALATAARVPPPLHAAAEGVAADAASSVRTTTLEFELLADDKPAGKMTYRVMEVQNKVIFQVRFEIARRDKQAGFDSLIVYRTGERPQPERATASTRLGTFKLMEGEAVFVPAAEGGGLVAQLDVKGFADRDQKPFDAPRELKKEIPVPASPRGVPAGLVLSAPAFLYFGPRLLDGPGRVENVVHLEVPDDIDFPEFLNFKTGCVLTRGEWDDQGRSEIVLAQRFPGDNYRPLAKITVDREGRIVAGMLGNFAFRPAAPEEPTGETGGTEKASN
jgi:hypothetical protein